ncbi:MAG: fibronectin-binding SSURE repeat-containing protein [Streptococcus sp.]|nr:fibronectin-binding SSURE repeat-containing protein [Streptococcus sp.]
MVNKNKMNPTSQNYTKWSIRRLSVGVASVVVASGFFVMTSSPVVVHAAEQEAPTEVVADTPTTTPTEVSDSASTTSTEVATPVVETATEAPTVTEETPVVAPVASPTATEELTATEGTEAVAPIEEAKSAKVLTTQEVASGITENLKTTTDVPASFLEHATGAGPFTAGVNQTIPFEAFGGDGMLTRWILKQADTNPWSDNGTAQNPALLPIEGLEKGQYYYQVSLDGAAAGKTGQELIDALKAGGAHTYQATVAVYGVENGKPNTGNIVATRSLNVHINALATADQVTKSVTDNIKSKTDVPAEFLANAKSPGPFTAGVNQVIPYEFFGGDGMLTRWMLKRADLSPWSDNGVAKNPALLPFDELGNGQYYYQVALDGNAAGKTDKELLDVLKANGTHDYKATVTVYGAKDGKADMSNVVATRQVDVHLNATNTDEEIKKSVAENIKENTDVPASFLANATKIAPFTAGVNQAIPYEFFGGDGMLTRLLLKSSDKAPWSDNGVDKNPALLPFDGLGNGQYFYQVDLDGNVAGKTGPELLETLKKNGTHDYKATVKVYGSKNGQIDMDNVVATRQVNLHLNGVTSADDVKKSVADNIKDKTDVPASFLANAKAPGPFTAGVNSVIPYEAFGGDGMLTRLLLKSSDGAPWSDNGTAGNPALLPLAGLGNGQYYYQVALDGDAAGKTGQDLIDALKAAGTHDYKATVTVYGVKDGKADMDNVVATRQVDVHVNGVTSADDVKKSVADNIKDKTNVPANFLANAKAPGPFTAGVNQVIPYEFFGGDGMLTRLLLKSSDGAPWSDNGTASNPALLPLAGLSNGQYFYQVQLDGNAAGKTGQELLDVLKANGTHDYKATIVVYGEKDGKADLDNIIATRQVDVHLNGQDALSNVGDPEVKLDMESHKQTANMNTSANPEVKTDARDRKLLPSTGEATSTSLSLAGVVALVTASVLGLVGIKRRKNG